MREKKRGRELKKLTAALLLTMLITQVNFAQSKQTSKKITIKEFGIESKERYTQNELEAILNIVFEENSKSIEKAFNEGYKQGLLASAPDAAYYKTLSDGLQKECAALNARLRFRPPLWALPICFLGGAAAGFALSYIGR